MYLPKIGYRYSLLLNKGDEDRLNEYGRDYMVSQGDLGTFIRGYNGYVVTIRGTFDPEYVVFQLPYRSQISDKTWITCQSYIKIPLGLCTPTMFWGEHRKEPRPFSLDLPQSYLINN